MAKAAMIVLLLGLITGADAQALSLWPDPAENPLPENFDEDLRKSLSLLKGRRFDTATDEGADSFLRFSSTDDFLRRFDLPEFDGTPERAAFENYGHYRPRSKRPKSYNLYLLISPGWESGTLKLQDLTWSDPNPIHGTSCANIRLRYETVRGISAGFTFLYFNPERGHILIEGSAGMIRQRIVQKIGTPSFFRPAGVSGASHSALSDWGFHHSGKAEFATTNLFIPVTILGAGLFYAGLLLMLLKMDYIDPGVFEEASAAMRYASSPYSSPSSSRSSSSSFPCARIRFAPATLALFGFSLEYDYAHVRFENQPLFDRIRQGYMDSIQGKLTLFTGAYLGSLGILKIGYEYLETRAELHMRSNAPTPESVQAQISGQGHGVFAELFLTDFAGFPLRIRASSLGRGAVSIGTGLRF